MKHDQYMQILIRTIQSGWPNERRRCPKQIQDFWNIRDELAIVDDESSPLVIKGLRNVIPLEQREEILQQLHIGHLLARKHYSSGFGCTSVVCSLFAAGYALDFCGDPGLVKRVVMNLLGACFSCNSVRLDLMLSHIV